MFKYTKSKQIKANYDYFKRKLNELPTTIYEAYARPSEAKREIFRYWQNRCNQHHATHLRILSNNCQHFTLGFIFTFNGEECFAYITAYNNYYCKVKELENDIN